MSSDDHKAKIKNILDAAQIHLVVATLLMTVTFTAGFTLPGGFESNDDSPNKGMAILAKKTAFSAFIVADAIAFVCSAGAVFSYFTMAAINHHTTKKGLKVLATICNIATNLLFLSMSAVVIAFVTGLYATLSHSVGLAATVCVIGCLSFLIYVLVFCLVGEDLSEDTSN